MNEATVPQLSVLARSGAEQRGWELFCSAGFDRRCTDPAVLAVKGRLLKGRARRAHGGAQTELLIEAAQAYSAANALTPAPYLAINAATLHLLAGETARAKEAARGVIASLEAIVTPADTPYFLAATRAEALLLLGDVAGAQSAMAEAARHDPDGWADRACTVAQFREIAAAQDSDAAWIDKFAPPASLHFAGHMGIAAGGASEAQLRADLAAHLAAHPVGFAWGALAAGADIIIAEALLAAGAVLHVVLPCPAGQFEAQSVAPAGADWSRRFAALIGQAASLSVAADSATSVHDPLATAFAGDLAIGGALSNAAQLASSAMQLSVLDEAGGGINTARQAERWRSANGVQHRLTVTRDAAVEALFPPEQPDPARQLAVHLCVLHDELLRGDGLTGAVIDAIAGPVAAALSALPSGSVRAAPGGWEAAITDMPAALAATRQLAELGSVAVGAHLAIGPLIADPASGTLVPFGGAPMLARRLASLAQTGTVLASDALAVTLCARGESGCRSELYYPWEDELGGPVHVLIGQ